LISSVNAFFPAAFSSDSVFVYGIELVLLVVR
jgi:hypothetical protein